MRDPRAADTTVTSLSVAAGPDYGKTLVTVTGTNFADSALLAVRFGLTADGVAARTFLSASTIKVLTPSLAASAPAVYVSNNNQDFYANAVYFTFQSTWFGFGCEMRRDADGKR
jgi:hypothetical protein